MEITTESYLSCEDCEVDVALEMTPRAQRLLYFAGTDRCSFPTVCLAIYVMGLMAILAWLFDAVHRDISDIPLSERIHMILQVGVLAAHVAALICHWFYARQKRFCQSSSLCRATGLPPTGIRSEIWVWFCCGFLLCTVINSYEQVRASPRDHITWGWLYFTLAFSICQLLTLLPTTLPHIATTLLLQEDLKHLSHELLTFVEGGNLEMCSGLLEDVSKTRLRWRCFLRWHFALEGATLVFFAFHYMFLPFLYSYDSLNDVTSTAVGPMAAVYLVMQIQCLARFSATISRCKETTQSEAMFRWIWQNESKLEFRVFGLTITHAKIKALMTSFVLSACSKAVVYLARK